MEIMVHDIVKFSNIECLEKFVPFPDWVLSTTSSLEYGVVRRMPISNQKVPIGLRGVTRDQRFGTFIKEENIIEIIKPPSLVDRIEQFQEQHYSNSLERIREEFNKHKLLWGPTGSIGFELATSIKVTSTNSDIDLSIYVDKLEYDFLKEIGDFLNTLNQRIDVQMEVPSLGAVLLQDYLNNSKTGFIVRTNFGPQMCKIEQGRLIPVEISI